MTTVAGHGMGFGGRLQNSWDATKQSWGVLRKDPELLLFPVISTLSSLIIVASFVAPLWFTGLIRDAFTEPGDPNASNIVYGVMFLLYFVTSFLTIYFNSALIFAANERLAGGDPTVLSGLRGANHRLRKIFLWSLFAATVSLLLQMIESALRNMNNQIGATLGRIFTSLAGLAWALVTFFVIPVILFEDKGVMESLKRSGSLFKQRWGETAVGHIGIGLVGGLLTMAAMLLGGLVTYLLMPLGVAGLAAGVAFTVGLVLTIAVLQYAMAGIYKVAVYRFANSGEVAPGFAPDLIQNAYRAA